MALMRIAFAVTILYYIAPHIGGDVIKSVRPVVAHAKSNLNSDALAAAALEYCKNNAQTCIKFAQSAMRDEPPVVNKMPVPINAALRSTLYDKKVSSK